MYSISVIKLITQWHHNYIIKLALKNNSILPQEPQINSNEKLNFDIYRKNADIKTTKEENEKFD